MEVDCALPVPSTSEVALSEARESLQYWRGINNYHCHGPIFRIQL